jgi:hypothetical protein
MTPLSDRQRDAFDNPAKAACRDGNLRVLREAAYLLWYTFPVKVSHLPDFLGRPLMRVRSLLRTVWK